MAKIIVTFDDKGNPSIDVSGIPGAACEEETRELERALGSRAANVRTPEYNQQARKEVKHDR